MKKVCVVTSSRADYGLLYPLIQSLLRDPFFQVQVVVTGSHLSKDFGETYKEIEKDGIPIYKKIQILEDFKVSVQQAKRLQQEVCERSAHRTTSYVMGLALMCFGAYFEAEKPDILVVLGDRYEIFAVAGAAVVNRILIAHLHGGEVTEGAYDEFFRHAITKMSHLHFTSCEAYRQRVIQLGEHPDRVYNVGAIGIENIKTLPLVDKLTLEKIISFKLDKPYGLVTFHPVTLEKASGMAQVEALLDALEELQEMKFIITQANADDGGYGINKRLEQFGNTHKSQTIVLASMGQLNYLSAMKYSACVIGNSSSGILEAPALGVPTVNIGDRQKGRIVAESVINCLPSRQAILKAIRTVHSPQFLEGLRHMRNPYGEGDVSYKIAYTMKYFLMQDYPTTQKVFYDLTK